MTFHGAYAPVPSPLGGTIQVVADSSISSDQTGANAADIWLLSPISGSANLTVAIPTAANSVVLLGTNSAYSGNWTCTSGNIQIGSGAVNALGSGSVTVQTGTTLTINAINDLVLANQIGGAGTVVKLNTNTVTLAGDNTASFTGTVQASAGVLKINSASAISSASLISLAGGTLDASPIAGLVLNAGIGQALSGSGTLVGNLSASTGAALDFHLSPTTNDILDVTGSLTLNGTPSLNLIITGFKPAGIYRLINYSGTILGGGAFNLVAPGGGQAFSLDYSTPGQVNLKIEGNPNSDTWVGDGFPNYWDTTSHNWMNDGINLTNFAQGDYVTFDDSGYAGVVYVAEAVAPSSVTVNTEYNTYVFTGDFGITSGGTLTKSGATVVSFENVGNNFTGPVDIRGGTLSVGAGHTTGSIGTPTWMTNNGVFQVNMAAGGPAVTVNAPITGSGAVTVTGGGGILTLGGTNSYTGATTVGDGCQLLFTTSSALGSPNVGTTVLANGRLGITTLVGAMTLAEPLTLNGVGITTGNNQGGALYMLGANNNLTLTAPITIASDSRVRVIDNNARMTFMNTVTGNNVALEVSVGTQPSDVTTLMTFSNTVSIGSGVLTKDGQGAAAFASANNTAGSTIVNEGTLLANNTYNGGPVTVNASGAIGGSGTILGPVSVGNAAVLTPGNAGIGTLTLNSTLSLAAGSSTLMEINRTNAQTSDLLVAGAIPLNGTLTVVNTGPALQVGDTFHLFTGAISGGFTNLNLPALALPSYAWNTSNLVSQGNITVISNALLELPLVITQIQKPSSTNVVLTWNSYPGRLYTVQYKLSLADTNWSTLQANIPCSTSTNTTTASVDNSGSSAGLNNTLVVYQMGTPTAQIQNAGNTMAAGDLIGGPGFTGLTLFNPNANVGPAYASAPELQASPPNATTTLDLAVANSSWFTFSLTVGTNLTDLDLTSLSFNGARGGGASPRGYGVYVTTPTTTDELVKGSTAFITQRPVWDPQNISLAGLSSLQNLTAGQVITFKIAVFAPASANSVEFDDITVKGSVTPAPLPPYVGSGAMFLRMVQQP